MKISRQLLVAAGLLALAAAPAFAYEPGTFIIRGGVGTVSPSGKAFSSSVDDPALGQFEACIEVDNGTGMTMSGTYMISQNWAFDVLGALPMKHEITFDFEAFGIPDVIDGGQVIGKLGDIKQIPPTFSFQYHFSPDSDFQPYVGLGVNWTTFTSVNYSPGRVKVDGTPIDDALQQEFVDALGIDKLYLDDSFGLAAQLGGDWAVGDRTIVSLDVRYMDIDTDFAFSGPAFDGKEKAGTLKIDPWVYSLNLGYRF
jgi:outer membrane protein